MTEGESYLHAKVRLEHERILDLKHVPLRLLSTSLPLKVYLNPGQLNRYQFRYCRGREDVDMGERQGKVGGKHSLDGAQPCPQVLVDLTGFEPVGLGRFSALADMDLGCIFTKCHCILFSPDMGQVKSKLLPTEEHTATLFYIYIYIYIFFKKKP
ncbi:hypothetical protein GGTG_10714 [Gaeumannomyces tritici R3-111a-1]|uniref:Uncharacterized protein n=1 Tax=Gaeumannomyces tritici (strain R3-111a-1) TaxID=644352 RepID=J3PB41_GAET3|nr:hypothetical protein GGTG_10714 [Gaeumannomyces tritici R3-111a-1]EJT71457.1 hypothetical protein GGTG_10714 [Gaeumannomyces tritici R3-111a-1]